MGESANQRPCCGRPCGQVWRTSLLSRRLQRSWRLRRSSRANSQPRPVKAPTGTVQHATAIVLARELRDVPPPLSLLDMPPPDDGIAGARLAINDNNTTGRFLKQEFTLEVVQSGADPGAGRRGERNSVEGGASFIVADASPQAVVALADSLKGRER